MSSSPVTPGTFSRLSPSRYMTLSIPHPVTPSSILNVSILDSPNPEHPPSTAALLVPPTRLSDWLFSTPAGHLHLLLTSPDPPSRLILLFSHTAIPAHHLTPLLLALSPKSSFSLGIPHIPLLAFQDDVTKTIQTHTLTGPVAGDMLVEDVEINGSELRRRLRFKRMPHLVQTQLRLLPDHVNPALLHPVVGSLAQPYLAPMAASLFLIESCFEALDRRPRALCVGVGGGALLMLLESELGFEVVGVEADGVVLEVARRHFGLVEGEFLKVVVGDGIELIGKFAAEDTGGFDVIMVDLDEADAGAGISAPTMEFMEKSVLVGARAALCEHGVLVVNVIAHGESAYEGIIESFREVFDEVHEVDVGNGENYVLIAGKSIVGSVTRAGPGDFGEKLKQVVGERYIDQIRRL